MFVIFGASGNTGSIVAATLLDRGKKVRVVARDATKVAALAKKGAEVVAGDVLDSASVSRALEGAEAAYLLVPPDLKSPESLARGRKIVDAYAAALAKSGVKHAVFLSSVASQLDSGTGPILITHYAETTLPGASPKTIFTFVRAPYFMENLLMHARAMKSDGVLPVFGGGEAYPFPMIAARDIGKIAADALLAPAAATRTLELFGAKEYSYADAASEASKILGRPVQATPVPIEKLVPILVSNGVSADMAGLYRDMTEAFATGKARFEGTHPTARGTTELGEVLRAGLA